jgi:hypothetical protein
MCSALGGCGSITSFGSSAKTKITNKKNAVTCLSGVVPPPPPSISAVTPGTAAAFQPAAVMVTGTGLGEVTKVTVGGVDVSLGSGLGAVTSTSVTFTPPQPASLGSKSVTVTNAGGTSNALTLSYVETDPPKLSADFLAPTTSPFTWSYGGGANDLYFLMLSLSNGTFQLQGQAVLANTFILLTTTLDAAGLGSLQVSLPPSAIGLSFWSQVLTKDGGGIHASNIANSWIAF